MLPMNVLALLRRAFEREQAYHERQQAMIGQQLTARGIADQRVLHAMTQVPRHLFVPAKLREYAYADCALPIEDGQTISQPFMVAYMLQALRLDGSERVLDVGTGSGYAAAVLSLLAAHVYTIERSPVLASSARERLAQLGYTNVSVVEGDGTEGLPMHAPFDAISVAAASPWIPRPLLSQLAHGGRLVIPVGSYDQQLLIRATCQDGEVLTEQLGKVRFVPLIGEHGWTN